MNRAAVISFGMVLAVLPSLASARIVLRGEQVDVVPGAGGTFTMDIFAQGTDTEDEQLGGYDLALRMVPINPSATGGARFASPYAVRPAEGFVFGTPETTNYSYNVPPNGPPVAGPTQFLLNVESLGAGPVNVTNQVKIAEIVFEVLAGTLPSQYKVEINQGVTNFGSLDPNRLDPSVEYTVSPEGSSGLINIVPEPASLSLLALGGLLALRRRRVA